jgi:ribosome maturation factor RimP
MYRETLSQSVEDTIKPYLEAQGVELIDLQLHQRKGRWLIRIFGDIEGGISLEDCRRLSREIGHVLDAEDLIPASYVLEVSSPGLDRPLHTPRDFQRQLQRLVKVFLRVPFADQTHYTGRVTAVSDTQLVFHLPPDTPLAIPFASIDHGVVELEFK